MPISLSAIDRVRITPKLAFVRRSCFLIPLLELHVAHGTAEGRPHGAKAVARADSLVGTAGAVVEIVRMLFVCFPEDDRLRIKSAEPQRRVELTAIACYRSVHHITGNLLLAQVEQRVAGVVPRTKVKPRILK